jgi:hypothetical protein
LKSLLDSRREGGDEELGELAASSGRSLESLGSKAVLGSPVLLLPQKATFLFDLDLFSAEVGHAEIVPCYWPMYRSGLSRGGCGIRAASGMGFLQCPATDADEPTTQSDGNADATEHHAGRVSAVNFSLPIVELHGFSCAGFALRLRRRSPSRVGMKYSQVR